MYKNVNIYIYNKVIDVINYKNHGRTEFFMLNSSFFSNSETSHKLLGFCSAVVSSDLN